MPFVEATSDSRKRGWEEDDWQVENTHCIHSPTSENEHPNFYLLGGQDNRTHTRKIQPLMKRARTTPSDSFHTTNSPFTHILQPSPPLASARNESSFDFRPTPPTRVASIPTPCHICHRKPTKKSHLDSFAQCQGCGEQTCFVCIRECMGWNVDDGSMLCEQEVLSRSFHMGDADEDAAARFEHCSVQGNNNSQDGLGDDELRRKGWDAAGHRQVVCSRCCIERGADGDIVCLGCLPRLEGA